MMVAQRRMNSLPLNCTLQAFFFKFILREGECLRAGASRGGAERGEWDRIPSGLHASSAQPQAGLQLPNRETTI